MTLGQIKKHGVDVDRTAPGSSTIILYAESEHVLRRWQRNGAPSQAIATADWTLVERFSDAAGCLVVQIPSLAEWEHLQQLKSLSRNPDRTPLIVITDPDRDNLKLLAGVLFSALYWSDSDLAEVLQEANAAGTRCPIFSSLSDLDFGRVARQAAEAACGADRPFRSVKALARSIGLDRRRLWLEWTRRDGEPIALPLADFVRWIVLIHAIKLRGEGGTWASIAEDLGVHERTLFRLAERHLRVRRRDLANVSLDEAVSRFRQSFADGTEHRSDIASPHPRRDHPFGSGAHRLRRGTQQ